MRDSLTIGWRTIFSVIIFTMIPFASCVTTQQEFTNLNDQVIALNKRVTRLEESMETRIGGDLNSKLLPIQSRQAEAGAELDKLKDDLQSLSGRVEENEHLVKRAVERDLGEQDAMQSSLVQLSQRMTELETLVRQNQQYLGLESVTPKKEQEKAAAGETGAGLKPPPGVVEEPKSGETDLYDGSLVLFQQGKYEQAMEGFKKFLTMYPKSDRADNAQFWIGECFMAMKQYEQAILAYQEVIKKYPNGNKVPNAMLRQSTAFLEINDKISTRLLLRKIIEKYPQSNEAKIARKKLETLK
jgi:tol-pal system protein YbgF